MLREPVSRLTLDGNSMPRSAAWRVARGLVGSMVWEEGRPASIGRYDVRREIGRGMMGVVYEAVDTVLGRTIALKTIHLAFPTAVHEREEFERRFFAEAQIAARLSHPNIVVVHDVGRDPETGTLFIALEHLDGQPLSTLVSPASPLPWHEALRIVQRVAEGLHHAHGQGVVHRDVKPANIVRLSTGVPKILDFGIARLGQEQGDQTQERHFFGTPLYMSPEQALGRPVDGRSDLFALGAVLYFLLVGRAAFAAENIPTILVRVVRQYPPPPSYLKADVPAAVDDVVARATAKDPADRYPDGKAMAEDIEDILAGRVARHREAWRPPSLPETAPGADDLLASLESELGLTETVAGSAARGVMPTIELPRLVAAPAEVKDGPGTEIADAAAPPLEKKAPRRWLVAAGIAAGVIGLAGQAGRGTTVATAPPATAAAVGTSTSHEAAAPVLLAAAVPRPAARRAKDPARFAVEVEHSLKQGRLRLWVDGLLKLERRLGEGAVAKVAMRPRTGAQALVALEPGTHEVAVEVAWGDKVRTEHVKTVFRAGESRVLTARIGGLFKKNLSLRWR